MYAFPAESGDREAIACGESYYFVQWFCGLLPAT
jgi:exoribonuclease R